VKKYFIISFLATTLFLSNLVAFSSGQYKCYNGGHKSIFILYDNMIVVHKEYTNKRYKGMWSDLDDEAEFIIYERDDRIKEYLIILDKNRNNKFIIYNIKHNRQYKFCKAKEV